MTSELELRGHCNDAFTHLLLVGLASILEDADEERTCEIWWNGSEYRAHIRTNDDDLDWNACAHIVHEHARRWHESSWLGASGTYSGSAKRATLSPRLGMSSTREGWESLQHDRCEAIDALQTILDRRYVGALGEPAYWAGSMDAREYTPDRGASRWEMVPRNRGQEFVTGRLVPLARAIADRTDEQIAEGLAGDSVVDEIGKNKSDSRSSTGLRPPSAVDNAQVWCALFGVSAFPVFRSTQTKRGPTTALFQVKGRNPFAVLPLWDEPWTLQRYRAVVRSQALLIVALESVLGIPKAAEKTKEGETREEEKTKNDIDARLLTTANVQKSRKWLIDKGVETCMLFPQSVSNNKSAPERWLLQGKALSLKSEGEAHGR